MPAAAIHQYHRRHHHQHNHAIRIHIHHIHGSGVPRRDKAMRSTGSLAISNSTWRAEYCCNQVWHQWIDGAVPASRRRWSITPSIPSAPGQETTFKSLMGPI
ncbi:hypothetical protein JDV02_007951 [Purpureocillium takamizusanense]|uniref:Uncharacterized protein n=1 Tax=Purpureocillium takamizusanense TaxID=2060973 RepID=A0A9Q8VDU5_9HYPO|nr:uncharacterized protein JDV02_007951 [Purpureocillium takamizusanense]UNI22023.1 hypothetical protein JDV02_007951 [Purpureocillium takamizusanense]